MNWGEAAMCAGCEIATTSDVTDRANKSVKIREPSTMYNGRVSRDGTSGCHKLTKQWTKLWWRLK